MDLANSYFEEKLKIKCAQIRVKFITVESVCANCLIAIQYNLNELKDITIELMAKNYFDVSITDWFQQLGKHFRILVANKAKENFSKLNTQ
jgi:hypothetical protein